MTDTQKILAACLVLTGVYLAGVAAVVWWRGCKSASVRTGQEP